MTDYTDQYARKTEAIATAIEHRAFAPHCDSAVLHRDNCWACDGYPDWRAAREAWGINFTGEHDPLKITCPAEQRRPVETINRWGGNIAETAEVAEERRLQFAQDIADAYEDIYTPEWRESMRRSLRPDTVLSRLARWWSLHD